MARDPELLAHQEWLGYLQPVGLVVSPPALAAAQALPEQEHHPRPRPLPRMRRGDHPGGRVRPPTRDPATSPGLRPTSSAGSRPTWSGRSEGGPLPESLEVTLTEYNETLRPTYAVREFSNTAGADAKWLLLIQKVKPGISLDDAAETPDHRWQASPQARFERLLREHAGADRPALQRRLTCGSFTPRTARPRAT